MNKNVQILHAADILHFAGRLQFTKDRYGIDGFPRERQTRDGLVNNLMLAAVKVTGA